MRRDFLLSFAGHAVILALAALLTTGRAARDTRRPEVLVVQMVSSGSPMPTESKSSGTSLVEAKPKAVTPSKARAEAKPKAEAKSSGQSGNQPFRRQGLGARIEGAAALGYSYYLNALLTKIGDNWLDPYLGQDRKATCTIVFMIERDGTIRDVKVEKTSADKDYDAAAERALLVLDRAPPLPPEFTGPRLKLHLEFEHTP